MATKYHINPDSGKPNICKAQEGNCPYGGEDRHYATREEARGAYEAIYGDSWTRSLKRIREQLDSESLKTGTELPQGAATERKPRPVERPPVSREPRIATILAGRWSYRPGIFSLGKVDFICGRCREFSQDIKAQSIYMSDIKAVTVMGQCKWCGKVNCFSDGGGNYLIVPQD